MSSIHVLVAATRDDLKAQGIAAEVKSRSDMRLVDYDYAVDHDYVLAPEVDAVLEALPRSAQSALVIVGSSADTKELTERWLEKRSDLIVMQVDFVGDVVRVTFRDPALESLMTALVRLVEQVGRHSGKPFSRIHLVASAKASADRPLLHACVNWIHAVLREAVALAAIQNGKASLLTVAAETLLHQLDGPVEPPDERRLADVDGADAALDRALEDADPFTEPLAAVVTGFALSPAEFRLMILALAPELDLRFQRCIGFLLDDMGRRTGSVTLYHTLMGVARGELPSGQLERWLVFEESGGRPTAGDEQLRIDAFLVQWLLGDRNVLAADPIVRRVLRLSQWPGAQVLERDEEREAAAALIRKLTGESAGEWIVLCDDRPAEWRALVELGVSACHASAIRVECMQLAGLDVVAVEECALRVGRMARLTGNPLVIDVAGTANPEGEDDRLRVFLTTLARTNCNAALMCHDQARIVRLLGSIQYEVIGRPALTGAARVAAVRSAARNVGAYLSEAAAAEMATRFPLTVDGVEQAMHLARSRPQQYDTDGLALSRFIAACKDVAAEGLSRLAERIEPVFDLDQVVLSADRKEQLVEIIDNIRLAPKVLDDWRFREQLPYGRGVTALFFGASGTGKTMAAIGIARRLGVQLLRLDLSRMVSKYIGDTEKNIDRVFTDAQRSGSAILIDEAEALLGKRSEVKDAHDRYANIEVAYLLQRMETYEGLAILTTNMRQNIDPAFLRRLRFIIEFPRPDVAARERIWRQCLPLASHSLDDAAFRQLARKIDLTGGHIRQITLRAAFIAAAAGQQIGLEHIAHAARAEYAKLGMPPAELDASSSRKAA